MSDQPWERNEGKYVPTSGVPRPEPQPLVEIDPEAERESLRGIEPIGAAAGDVESVEGEDVATHSHRMLRSFIERIENLDDQIAELRDDRKEVVAAAKANGLDRKALMEVLRRRKMDPDKLAELDALVEVYESALGGAMRGMVWGGDLRPPAALSAPTTELRSRRAADALALLEAADRAERG